MITPRVQEVLNRMGATQRSRVLEALGTSLSEHEEFHPLASQIAMSWLYAGGDEDSFLEAIETSELGISYPRHNRLGYHSVRAFAKAERDFTPVDPGTDNINHRLQQVYSAVEESSMRPPLKATALALVSIGIDRGLYTVNASVRELAELSGNSAKTCAKHLKELAGKDPNPARKREFVPMRFPLLRSSPEQAAPEDAATSVIELDYGLGIEEVGNKVTPNTHIGVRGLGVTRFHTFPMTTTQEVHWYWETTGSKAGEVYARLTTTPKLVSAIATYGGGKPLDRKTVSRHLEDLIRFGLAREEAIGKRRGYAVVPGASWAKAYQGYRVYEFKTNHWQKIAKRSNQYEQDRVNFQRVTMARQAIESGARDSSGGIVLDISDHWEQVPEPGVAASSDTRNYRTREFRQERESLFSEGKRRCIRCWSVLDLSEFTTARNGANGVNSTCNECRVQDQLERYTGLFESLRDGEKRAREAGLPAEHLTASEVLEYWSNHGIDPWECVATGKQLTQDTRNIDHVRALSDADSPGHVLSNIVPVHAEYNRFKGTKPIPEAVAGWWENSTEKPKDSTGIEGSYVIEGWS